MSDEIPMSLFGKCTEDIKTRVPFDTKESLVRMAHEAQMNESEFLRMIITLYVYGEQEVLRLQQEQLNKITKRFPQ